MQIITCQVHCINEQYVYRHAVRRGKRLFVVDGREFPASVVLRISDLRADVALVVVVSGDHVPRNTGERIRSVNSIPSVRKSVTVIIALDA